MNKAAEEADRSIKEELEIVANRLTEAEAATIRLGAQQLVLLKDANDLRTALTASETAMNTMKSTSEAAMVSLTTNLAIERSQFEQTVTKFQAQLQDLQKERDEHASLASTHRNDLDTLRTVSSEAAVKHTEERTRLELQCTQLEQQVDSLQKQVQKLEEKFHCNQVTLSTQREELKKLTKLEKELQMVGKRAECVTNDRDVLSDRSTELKSQLTALRNRIALAEKDRDALLVQNVELEMELSALAKRAANAEKEREESASRSWFRRAIVEEKAVTQTKYDLVMQDLSTAHTEIAEYKRQVIEMTMKRIDDEGTICYNPHLPNSQQFLLALIRLYMLQPYKNTPR